MTGAIVAMGGGGFSTEPDNPLLDRFVLGLARREHPRVCFVATASGDSERYVASCPHYDSEEQRRPVYHQLVADGFPAGYAADDGAALHFSGSDELAAVVASRDGARCYRVERGEGGAVVETPLPTRYLG